VLISVLNGEVPTDDALSEAAGAAARARQNVTALRLAKACERTNRRHSGGELVGHILTAPNPLRKSVFA
jgi:hypothetical protein